MSIDQDSVHKILEWEPLVGRLTRGQASSQSTAILLAPNLLLTCAHVLVEDASLGNQKLKDKKIEEIVNSAKERATQSGQHLNNEINNIILENKGIIDRIQDQCVWVGDSCASLNPFSFLHVSLRNTQGSSSIGAERLDFAIVGLNEPEKGWSSESIRAWKNLTPFILERSPDSFTTRDKVYILGYPLYEEIVEKLPKQKIKTYHTFNPRKISHIQTFITSGETCYLGYFEQANMFHRSGQQIGVTSINEGLSGAPVFNSQGEWLGFHHGVKGTEGLAVQVSAVADYIKKNAITLPLFELEDRFLRLLADHYYDQEEFELSILKRKFDKKKNELIFHTDRIYAELTIMGEEEKKEVDDAIDKPQYDQRLESYESTFKNKKKLNLEQILENEKIKEKKKQRRMIYGSPGVGKTMMSFRLALKAKELWPDCSALFLIQLSQLADSKEKDVNKVIATQCGFEREEQFIDLLKDKSFRDRAILLLDGYDEFPRESSHLCQQLLSKLITSFNTVILTSRPGMPYPRGFDKDCLELEIMGFDDENRNRYIQKFFEIALTGDKEKAAQKSAALTNSLDSDPLAKSLAHTPINLCFICCLTLEGKSLFSGERSITVSYFYHEMVKWSYKQEARPRLLETPYPLEIQDDEDPRSSNPKIDQLAEALEKVAWEAMRENTRDIPKGKLRGFFDWIDLGLINKSKKVYRFTHFTLQEYFAASALAQLYLKGDRREAESRVKEIKFNPHYQMVLSMTAGILSLEYEKEKEIGCEEEKYKTALESYFRHLYDDPRDSAQSYELQLFARCFEECVDPEALFDYYPKFIEEAIEYFKNAKWVELKYRLLNRNYKLLNHSQMKDEIIKDLSSKNQQAITVQLLYRLAESRNPLPSNIVQKLADICTESPKSKWRLDAIKIIVSLAKSRALIDSKEVHNALVECLTSPEAGAAANWARRAAAEALEELVKSKALTDSEGRQNALVKCLMSPEAGEVDKWIRYAAAKALGELARSGVLTEKSNEAQNALVECLTSPETGAAANWARRAAAGAFEELAKSRALTDSKKTQNALVKCLTSPEAGAAANWVRCAAVKVLEELVRSGVLNKESKEAQNALVKCLTSPEAGAAANWTRRAAARAFEELVKLRALADRKKTQNALVKCLTSPETGVAANWARRAAAKALEELVRSGVLNEEGKEAQNPLVECLTSPETGVAANSARRAAAKALEELVRSGVLNEEGKEAQNALVKCLMSKESGAAANWARRAAAKALEELVRSGVLNEESKEAQNALVECLMSPEAEAAANWTRRAAARALEELAKSRALTDSKKTQNALVKCLTSPETGVAANWARCAAAKALKELAKSRTLTDSKKTQNALVKCLTSPEVGAAANSARCAAAKALEELVRSRVLNEEGKEAQNALVKCLTSPETGAAANQARRAAARAFEELAKSRAFTDSKKTQNALVKCLMSPETGAAANQARCAAAKALEELVRSGVLNEEDKEAQNALVECLMSKEPGEAASLARCAAAEALAGLAKSRALTDSKKTQNALVECLTSPETGEAANQARRAAAEALAGLAKSRVLNEEGKEAQNALVECLTSPETGEAANQARCAAAKALEELVRSGVLNEEDKEAQNALVECLMSKEPGEAANQARCAAAEALEELAKSRVLTDSKKTQNALVECLRSPEKGDAANWARCAAAEALEELAKSKVLTDSEEAQNALAKCLRSPEKGDAANWARCAAAKALQELAKSRVLTDSKEVQNALVECLMSQETEEVAHEARCAVVEALQELAKLGALTDSEKTQNALVARLISEETGWAADEIRRAAAEALRVIAQTKDFQNREACYYSSLPFVSVEGKGKEKEEK